MYDKNKSLHTRNRKVIMEFFDDNEEIFMTEQEEKNTIKELEHEKNNSTLKQKFDDIKINCNEIDFMLKILAKALKNEFEQPTIDEVDDYLSLLLKHFDKHKNLLNTFEKQLPESKAKLISLSYKKFKD